MTGTERSGWRDEDLSRRHRRWGYDINAVDLDLILAEYDEGRPVALIEYKHVRAARPDTTEPSYEVLNTLATNSNIPAMIVTYDPDGWTFRIAALNAIADDLELHAGWWTEHDYVDFLWQIRGRPAPPAVLRNCNG